MPGHCLTIKYGAGKIKRYWDVRYGIDWDHPPSYFEDKLEELLSESVRYHLRSDVEVGSYVSGGIDSSLLLNLASKRQSSIKGFHGRFTDYSGYDESNHAQSAVELAGGELHTIDITVDDFVNNIDYVIKHLDYPVAGPVTFTQINDSD